MLQYPMIKIPRKKIQFDIDGKIYTANALSMYYLMQSTTNPEFDTIDEALKDCMPELTDEDYKHFDAETKQVLYKEIVKFTFDQKVDDDKKKEISEALNITEKEMASMSQDTLIALSGVVDSRQPDTSKKKPSQKR